MTYFFLEEANRQASGIPRQLRRGHEVGRVELVGHVTCRPEVLEDVSE